MANYWPYARSKDHFWPYRMANYWPYDRAKNGFWPYRTANNWPHPIVKHRFLQVNWEANGGGMARICKGYTGMILGSLWGGYWGAFWEDIGGSRESVEL